MTGSGEQAGMRGLKGEMAKNEAEDTRSMAGMRAEEADG
jgi:hypothetical protein